jgi:kinesin family protein 13
MRYDRSHFRTCVNGAIITKKTQLKNGNRLLIGNNHYFRVNCPTIDKLNSTPIDDNQTIEFDEVVREVRK